MFTIAFFIVIFTVLSVLWLERQQNSWIKKILDWVPAILFAYVIPATFTHIFGWDLSKVELHNWSKTVIIPFAILMVMSALSFKQLKINLTPRGLTNICDGDHPDTYEKGQFSMEF